MRKTKRVQSSPVKYWDIIVNKIIKAGFGVGWSRPPAMTGTQSGFLTRIATESASP